MEELNVETRNEKENVENETKSEPEIKQTPPQIKGAALVLGASGEQGHAVIKGLVKTGQYAPVYGATRDVTTVGAIEASILGSIVVELDPSNASSLERVLLETKAQYLFVVTTTDLTSTNLSFKEAEDQEYDTIITILDMVVACHFQDNLERHVVLSTLDNVKGLLEEGDLAAIAPLEDGSVVAHYSGKGRAAEYALEKLKQVPGVKLTLLTLPCLYSSFLTWAIPLPNDGQTQWTISVALGDAEIDIMSAHDLAFIVRKCTRIATLLADHLSVIVHTNKITFCCLFLLYLAEIFQEESLYQNHNLRVAAERLSMYQIAQHFGNLFGKDVIYNPLTVEEMMATGCIAAPICQACHWLTLSKSQHDIALTEAIMFPRKPQRFMDWLLTHSDNAAFGKVGLTRDPEPIQTVTVFGATSLEGTSVVKGLLADNRISYQIRATSRNVTQSKALALVELDPERVELYECDYENLDSCKAALEGSDGAFWVMEEEDDHHHHHHHDEKHAKNVIDACAASKSLRHLVFSTKENLHEMNKLMKMGLENLVIDEFDYKAKAAAYARTQNLSCTFVLMPYYLEHFLMLLKAEADEESTPVLEVPDQTLKLMIMSVEELGPAVANIFDSYQMYAGHEIGLVTDYVTISEAVETIKETVYKETDVAGNTTTRKVRRKIVQMEQWIEKRETITKDLGQLFKYYSKSEAVQKRKSIAETLRLLPDARPLRQWLEDNKDDAAFRQNMGIR